MTKRKVTYEQDLALSHGRALARSNQKRRMAASRVGAERLREQELEAAKQAERELVLRGGFEVGARVTGRDFFWNERRTGVVVDGDLHDGVPVLCDDGETRVLYRNSLEGCSE